MGKEGKLSRISANESSQCAWCTQKANRGEHNDDHGELDEVYHLNDSFAKPRLFWNP